MPSASPGLSPALSAVWRQPGVRMAVINGAVVAEGSFLPPFQVERIEDRSAVLNSPTGLLTLRLAAPSAPPTREAHSSQSASATAPRRAAIPPGAPLR